MTNLKLAKKLKGRRESLRLTVQEAAAKAGVGVGEVVFVENGNGASPATLRGLGKAYGLGFIDLMIAAGHVTRRDVAQHVERRAA